jgi:hypothetical protein
MSQQTASTTVHQPRPLTAQWGLQPDFVLAIAEIGSARPLSLIRCQSSLNDNPEKTQAQKVGTESLGAFLTRGIDEMMTPVATCSPFSKLALRNNPAERGLWKAEAGRQPAKDCE